MTRVLVGAGGNGHLFSGAGQWKQPLSCHLGTDRIQLEASQSGKRDPGSQGKSVVMAFLSDLERGGKSILSSLFLQFSAVP